MISPRGSSPARGAASAPALRFSFRFFSLWLAVVVGAVPAAAALHPLVPAFGGVRFEAPVHVVFAPGETSRAFVVERAGRIALVRDVANPAREVVLDLSAKVNLGTVDHGLLSIAFHPDFAGNGYVYLWTSAYEGGARFLRLLRFTMQSSGILDPATELTLFSQPVGPGGHDGGTLAFGPDGYLYLSIGDGDQGVAGAEAIASHQRIDRGFFGAVLRIDVDKKAGSVSPNAHGGQPITAYAIPPDNPFVGATSFNGEAVDPTRVRTEFWAVGLRNPFRMAFDASTGVLWLGDVGLDTFEEVNLIQKGRNYGWHFREGNGPGPRVDRQPAGVEFTGPVWQYGQALGDASITGGVVYRGNRFPALQGRYVFADFMSGRVWAFRADASTPVPAGEVSQIASAMGIVGITEQPGTGDLLFANISRDLILKLAEASPPAEPPTSGAQPAHQTVAAGSTAVLRAELSGSPAPTVQWYRNGRPVAGGTEPTLVIANASPSHGGTYTAIATNAAGSVQTRDAELTVVAADEERRMVNLSTRGWVGTGAQVLIGGFVVGGSTAKTVLIRAAGPALAAFGVDGTVAAPELTLYSGNTVIATNRGWGGAVALKDAAGKVYATPWTDAASKDAAILITLAPGNYTAAVSGANGTTGLALLEIYDVP